MTMSTRLLLPLVLKQTARNCHCLRARCGAFATFSSRHDTDDTYIHVRSSLRGEKNWKEVSHAFEKLLKENLDPRILKTKLPELLLECIHAQNTDAGPMAGRLLELGVKNGRPSAEFMHMVRE